MYKFSFLLLGLVLCFTSFKANAQSPTAAALDFNMMVENNAQFKSSEMEGPLAVGNDLTIVGNYSVNIHNHGSYKVSGVPISMVVNGKVNYNSGNSFQIHNGHVKIRNCGLSKVWYTDMNNATPPIRITKDANYNSNPAIHFQQSAPQLGVSATNNPVCEPTNINFSSSFINFRTNAINLSGCTDNAVLKTSNGNLLGRSNMPNQVKVYLNSGANILNITGTELNNIRDFIFDGGAPQSSKFLIINVDAQGTFNWNVYNTSSFGGLSNCKYILYNFYNTTQLTITNNSSAIEGTVFAPNADIVKKNYSNLEGQVIAKSFNLAGGGEIHYAPFLPSYTGCSTPIAPTVSQFNITSNTSQCLSGNSFIFSNQSTGDGVLTYSWNFGDGTTSTNANPTKVYSAAGTYTVTLTTTGTGGSNTSTQSVVVYPQPQSTTISVNATSMPLSSNSFVFTVSPNNPNYTYSWNFDNGTISSSANPTKVYSLAGTYNVVLTIQNQDGCSETSLITVTVVSDNVNPGSGGGLESESLGGLITERDFGKIKNSVNSKVTYKNLPVFQSFSTKSSNLELADMIPQEFGDGLQLRITSPEDLLELTIAKEVLSVDYVKENNAKAVVLGIKTYDRAYNHTKSACDRFTGGSILSIDTVTIRGFQFLAFSMRTDNNKVEHSIAFVIGENTANNSYDLQTNWLIGDYKKQDVMFNFQVWSVTPEYTAELVEKIIDKLGAAMPVKLIQDSPTPPAYVISGLRALDNLQLIVNNNTEIENAYIRFEERRNEESGITEMKVPLDLSQKGKTQFNIPIKDGYEYQGYLYLNDELVDEVYLADGGWGLDFDKSLTTLKNYQVENNPNRVYHEDEYPMYRNVSVSALTDDYISVYKAIKPGTHEADMSMYKSIRFYAKGNGRMEIKLTKGSIVEWDNQYAFSFDLNKEGREYIISLNDFVSPKYGQNFNPNDLKLIVFSDLHNGSPEKELSFKIDEVSFSKKEAESLLGLDAKVMEISPNPNHGEFNCFFMSPSDQHLTVKAFDITGREWFSQQVEVTFGQNVVPVSLPKSLKGMVIISLGNDEMKYESQKIIVR